MKSYFNYSEIEKINIDKIINKFGNDYRINAKGNLDYNCPFCESVRGKSDKSHKFVVDVKTTIYHCFKCNTSGIIVKHKLSNSEKIIPLITDYFIEENNEEHLDSNKLLELNNVMELKKDSVGYEYLQNRKITDEHIMYYNIMNGINEYFGRIVVPNIIISKWTDFYQGRSYLNMEPKYLNPEDVDKSNIVFNLHNQNKKQKRIYIVEGVFSAILAGKDVISIFGSSISDRQIKLISDYEFEEIYCCLDGDETGQLGNMKLMNALNKYTQSNIYNIKLPEDRDPADMGEKEFKEYCEYKKLPFINSTLNNILSYFDY